MGELVLHCSISLDGYATGPDGDLSRLHRWMVEDDPSAPGSLDEATRRFQESGAVVLGRRTYDAGRGPWGDDDVFSVPVFVVTHESAEPLARNGTVFTFVDGVQEAVRRALAAAGGRDVALMGSPSVAQQALAAGLVDALELQVVPVLLGAGTRLFGDLPAGPVELEPAGVVTSSLLTGLRHRVR